MANQDVGGTTSSPNREYALQIGDPKYFRGEAPVAVIKVLRWAQREESYVWHHRRE